MVSWPWPQGDFPKKRCSDRVEMIFMSHLTMETPTDHPYHSGRVNFILMLQLTMVSWGISSCFGFINSFWSCWINFNVSPDHGNPNWPSILFRKSWLHSNVAADHGQLTMPARDFSQKTMLWTCWIEFDVSPDHGNPNWPSIPFKKSWLLFNVAADHGQLGFFLIIWLYKQFLIMLNQFWCFTWPWKPQLTITSIPKQLTIF